MFKEYALDPSLIRDWACYDRFVNRIIWCKGRALSRCPREWISETLLSLRQANCKPVQRKKIVERLHRLNPDMVDRANMPTSSNGNWYGLAKNEHDRQPFACAVSRVNPEGLEWVLRGEDFDSRHPQFQPCGAPVDRTADAFAAALKFLLKTAKQVHFVDPHFQPAEPRFREPMEAFLDTACGTSLYRAGAASLLLHVTYDHKQPIDENVKQRRIGNLKQELIRRLPVLIPSGNTVRVLVWDKLDESENFHNRYVLTERAGVLFGTGLDQQNGTGQTDDLCRLTTAQHATRMQLYNVTAPDFVPTFSKIDDLMVVGTRRA